MNPSPWHVSVAACPAWHSVFGNTRLWDHPSLCEYDRAQSVDALLVPCSAPQQDSLATRKAVVVSKESNLSVLGGFLSGG